MEIAWRNQWRSVEGVVPTKVGRYQSSVCRNAVLSTTRVHRPADFEGTAATFGSPASRGSVMGHGNRPHHRQAETGAAALPRARYIGALEGFKDAVAKVVRHTRATILNGYGAMAFGQRHVYAQRAGNGMAACVFQ